MPNSPKGGRCPFHLGQEQTLERQLQIVDNAPFELL
jgi:hypothetical protein